MSRPYEIFRKNWLNLDTVLHKASQDSTKVISGENSIHARGFFLDLSNLADTFGDSEWWLIDLESGERYISFSKIDTEDDYFKKLKLSPEWAPGRPFTYAVQRQAFIGENWILLSDRDADRMFLISQSEMSPEQLIRAKELVRG